MDQSDYEAMVSAAIERDLATPDDEGNVMPPEQRAELLAILRSLPSTEQLIHEREDHVVELVRDRTAEFGPVMEQVMRLAGGGDVDGPARTEIVWRDPTSR